jgi:hypothetical protein
MIGRWGLYSDLMRDLRASGLTPDVADQAARIAERAIRERRDHFIRAAVKSGATYRQVSKVWGLSIGMIHSICVERSVTPEKVNAVQEHADRAE